jgi:hypothetical protein
VADFVEAQRKRILASDVLAITKKSLNDIFHISEKFLKEYRECWGLPDDFKTI